MYLNKLSYFLILIFIIGFSSCENKNKDAFYYGYYTYNLKNKVKSFKERSYIAKDVNGKIEKDEDSQIAVMFGNSDVFFHKNGFLKEKIYVDREGKIEQKEIYNYYENFKIKEKLIIDSLEDTIKLEVYKYDKDGFTVYDLDKSTNPFRNDYDTLEISKYNSKNLLDECRIFDYSGELNRWYKFVYRSDADDYSIEEYAGENDLLRKTNYKSDKEKHLKLQTSYEPNGELSARTELWLDDTEEYVMNELFIDYNKDTTKTEYSYDQYNNIMSIKQIHRDNIRKNRRLEYEYDENSNWIKRIEFENNTALIITEREYDYF
ncbi:MAG: hypothetical protein N4A49_12630 [Marinifilaceae bacterium]|jgi:hypothetical protein|nr:hypothetical protein [Marinifilaceae bacterium]